MSGIYYWGSCTKGSMAGGGSAEPIGIHNLSILLGSVILLSVLMMLFNRIWEAGSFSIDGSALLLFVITLIGGCILYWGFWHGTQIANHSDNSDIFEAELID